MFDGRQDWELDADEEEARRAERRRHQKFVEQTRNCRNVSKKRLIFGSDLLMIGFVMLAVALMLAMHTDSRTETIGRTLDSLQKEVESKRKESDHWRNEASRIGLEFQRFKEGIEKSVRTD